MSYNEKIKEILYRNVARIQEGFWDITDDPFANTEWFTNDTSED